MNHEVAEAIEARIDALKKALAPWSRGKPYLNFAERQVAIGDAIGAKAFARLEAIKSSIHLTGDSVRDTRSRRRWSPASQDAIAA